MTTPSEPYTPPTVEQRIPRPAGLLPKNVQPWLIGGIALVMVLIFAFSTPSSKPALSADPAKTNAETPRSLESTKARIDDFRAQIDEQSKRFAAEQERFKADRQIAEANALAMRDPLSATRDFGMDAAVSAPAPSPAAQLRAELAADRLRRDYFAQYSSSLVISRLSPKATNEGADPMSAQESAPAPTSVAAPPKPSTSHREYRLFEGTVIEAALVNRLDGSFAGPVKCLVTTNVYSPDRLRLLIPQGSEVLGKVIPVESAGQQRLALLFHRILRSDGYSVDVSAPGLSQEGQTGLRDKVNHHYVQMFAASLAIGTVAGLTQAETRYGPGRSSADVYRQGVASSLSDSALRVLERFINVLPTFTIREGQRVKVVLTRDVDLPTYDPHRPATPWEE